MKQNAQALYDRLHTKLGDLVPEFELEIKAGLALRINELKEERNAVILGHNYMEPALYHSIPDFTGDSLELCRKAATTDKDIIVFCGVRFMAETAKILNPTKTVLIPLPKAGCSLAESITAADVRMLREKYPGVPVVSYVNTYADVKAESDICCTSGNAAKVVESLQSDRVIFLPDEYLAANVANETGKRIIYPTRTRRPSNNGGVELEYEMIGWHGRCEVHEKFTVADIENVRRRLPDVVVLAHPECSREVVAASDFSGSTSEMARYVREVEAARYLLLTECSMGDNIAVENPNREMVRLCSIRCPHMNEITLEQTLAALEETRYVVDLDEDLRKRALRSVERMIGIG
ncbi:MAG: quinolinate synthase NadA [Spirochaetaceae bacterium]|nr:MAG: quinolinate synthase NadA [Spirochaetaceae bacterium]